MKTSIKKIIMRNIVIIGILALIAMDLMSYMSQLSFSKRTLLKTAEVRIEDAKERLKNSEAEIAALTENLNQEYLTKARIFSQIINLDPSILEDAAGLERIRQLLSVDELHVTDETGVIRWGTVPEYFGFDFKGSEQTQPFLPILTDSSFELAQEATPNGAEGKLFQYISVSRYDRRGIVQVGMEPVRLTNALRNSQPDVVLGGITVGQNGTMFAVNKSGLTLAAYQDPNKIGTSAADIGFTDSLFQKGEGKIKLMKIDGQRYYVCAASYGDYYIGTMIPISEALNQALILTIVILLMTALIIGALSCFTLSIVNKNIINQLDVIGGNLKQISGGNTDIRVDVRNCSEFNDLSDGINGMLDSIASQIQETSRLNVSMESLLQDVYKTSQSINSYSAAMQDVSRKISDGSSSQAATVRDINAAFESVASEVRESAGSAENASSLSRDARDQLSGSVASMDQMKKAMEQITAYSRRISLIVKTIEDIASQTNILALNAAVEAARAGQHGKGFAVVADEVRNLAAKSAEAAKDTTKLISETLNAVDNGNVIANEAAEALQSTIEGIEKSVALVAEISAASTKQADDLNNAMSDMHTISEIAQNNSEIALSAQETADRLDSEAAALISLIDSRK